MWKNQKADGQNVFDKKAKSNAQLFKIIMFTQILSEKFQERYNLRKKYLTSKQISPHG